MNDKTIKDSEIKILFIDDDTIQNNMLYKIFKQENFNASFITNYKNSVIELEKLKNKTAQYNLIVFDLNLPDGSGFDLVSFLRSFNSEIPVLILSGNDAETAKVTGLNSGADDYLCKPFSIKELQARVKALLRRQNRNSVITPESKVFFEHKELKVDFNSLEVYIKNKKINLNITEFKILEYLIKNLNTIVDRQSIISYIRGGEYIEEISINSHISRLRKKLKSYSKIIETVPCLGYKIKIKET